ncbi:MAG: hypothetical protein ABRQ37_11950 [Candidatus Eremiobacterota bacterium]
MISDNSSGELKYFRFCMPTKKATEKYSYIQIENFFNIPSPELDNRTPFEDTIINKNSDNFFKLYPVIKKSPMFKIYKKLMAFTKQEFNYKSVYSKTGGLLNLINPEVDEYMDKELQELLKSHKEDSKKAITIWKDKHSEIWSNMPPKLVWAGGGDVETKLLTNFAEKLSNRIDGKGYTSPGEIILESLLFLRIWQFIPNEICSEEQPWKAIIQERQKIYERKILFLKEMNIENDFS